MSLENPSTKPKESPNTTRVTWVALAGLIVLSIVLTLLGERLPEPLGENAPANRFAAGRAMPVLREMTDLGIRLSATPTARKAAEQLAARIRSFPGVEDVTIEEAAYTRQYTNTPFPYPMLSYRTLNVMARLPGRTRDAVLLNAHYDTTGSSVGAGDDAFGVATLVEVFRALSLEERRERSVILLLNGGEEYGLRGADAFTHHAWARDVRAYVYIDGMGGGKPRLLDVTKGRPEFIDMFSQTATRPSGNVIMQELVDNFDLGGDGDFRPFRDAGLAGLSFACIGELAAAHSSLDTIDRVDPAAMQLMGDNVLALTRRLAEQSSTPPTIAQRPVYFDVFGRFMVRYSNTTSNILGGLAVIAAIGAITMARHRGRVTGKQFGKAFGILALGQFAGFVAAIGSAGVLALGLGRSFGWYTAPWLAGVLFGFAAAAGVLGVHHVWRKRMADETIAPWTSWAACLAAWAFVLTMSLVKQVATGYLAFVWTISLAIGLFAALRRPDRFVPIALASMAPGLFVIANAFIPTVGSLYGQLAVIPVPVPGDIPAALLGALPVLATVAGLMVVAHAAGRIGRAAFIALSIATVTFVVVAIRKPFDAGHPRRLIAVHAEQNGRSAIALRPWDALPLDPDVAGIPEITAARSDWTPIAPPWPPASHEYRAEAPTTDPPRIEVLQSKTNADGTRTVSLRFFATTSQAMIKLPRAKLAGWSFSPNLPSVPADGEYDIVLFSGLQSTGETCEFTFRGGDPVEIEMRSLESMETPVHREMLQKLPPHISLWPESQRIVTTKL